MASRLTFSAEQYFNATDKTAYAGAKMYTYVSGTTTDKTTWTAVGEGTPLANPIVADANGIFPEIYGDGAYTITIKNTDDTVTIYSADNVYPTVSDLGVSGDIVVANVVALKALDITVYTTADVLGTTTTNDGGQVRYYYDSSSSLTDNGTTVVTPDVGGGRWLILPVRKLATGWIPQGSVSGLRISNGGDTTNDIDVSVGQIMDSTAVSLMSLTTAITKQIDVDWVAGSGAGGFASGLTLTNGTWYRVFLIAKTDGTTVDCGFDTSATAANLLSDASTYTYYRRIGWVYYASGIANWGSSNNRKYAFKSHSQPLDTSTFPTSSRTALTLICPPLQTAYLSFQLRQTANSPTHLIITSLLGIDSVASANDCDVACNGDASGAVFYNRGNKEVVVDSSSQIGYRADQTPAGGFINIWQIAWQDDLEIA